MAEDTKPAAKKPAASTSAPAKAVAAKAAATPATEKAAAPKVAAAKAAAPKAATEKAVAPKVTAPTVTAPTVTAPKVTAPKVTAPRAATEKAAAPKAAAKPAKKKPAVDPGPKVDSLRMHHLRPADGAHTPKTRVGRGQGSKGKTAGRGTKGTGARYQVSPRFEGGQTPIHMRIPKLRGFRSPFKITYQVVNVAQLAELYPKGGTVTKVDLVEKGAVRKNQPVKLLGDGEIAVKVIVVDADRISQSAKSKIEAAGGSVNQG
jgi:large subunit ribosomal protein L15